MNYPPHYHVENDERVVMDALDAIRHGTLIVRAAAETHLAFTPFLLDRERRVLRGHIAARNPQAALLNDCGVDVVFHGPHAYISPRLNDNDDVPTWNYVNVHVHGRTRRLDDEAAKWNLLRDMVHAMERDNAATYLRMQEGRLRKLLPGIVAFEIAIDSLVGRFKLGRNDPLELQRKTFAALSAETPASLLSWLSSLAPGGE